MTTTAPVFYSPYDNHNASVIQPIWPQQRHCFLLPTWPQQWFYILIFWLH